MRALCSVISLLLLTVPCAASCNLDNAIGYTLVAKKRVVGFVENDKRENSFLKITPVYGVQVIRIITPPGRPRIFSITPTTSSYASMASGSKQLRSIDADRGMDWRMSGNK
jgi:hypothetical protein